MNSKKILLPDVSYKISELGVLIIGSISVNQYVKINSTNAEAIISVLKMFDGTHEDEFIEEYCQENNIHLNLSQLIGTLSERGLFEGMEIDKTNNEIELLGMKIFLKEYDYIQDYKTSISIRIYISIFWFINVVALILCFINYKYVFHIFNTNLLKYKGSYIMGMGITFVISTITLVLHEIGHCLMAANNNIQIHKIGLFLYLGFIPKWFINFRGIRVASKLEKISVFLGGVIFNFSNIVIVCALAVYINNDDLVRCFIVSNLLMILNCMIPFSLTDGYFLFSSLFNIDNLRIGMLNSIFSRESSGEKKSGVIFYYILSILFWLYKTFILYYWLYCGLKEIKFAAEIIIIIVFFIHTLLLINNMKKKGEKVL